MNCPLQNRKFIDWDGQRIQLPETGDHELMARPARDCGLLHCDTGCQVSRVDHLSGRLNRRNRGIDECRH